MAAITTQACWSCVIRMLRVVARHTDASIGSVGTTRKPVETLRRRNEQTVVHVSCVE